MRQLINSRLVEVRIGYLLPFFLAVALWSNFEIAQASPLRLREFAPVVVRASGQADYSADPADLVFAPVEAGILEDIRKDAARQSNQEGEADAAVTPAATSSPAPGDGVTAQPTSSQPTATGTLASATPTPTTATPTPGQQATQTGQPNAGSPTTQPTAPPIIQTLAPVVPTVLPIVPTLAPIIPTLAPIVPTLVPIVPTLVPVIPTLVAPIATLVPIPIPTICVPLPLLNNCG
jgi:hypothetical protein